MPYADALYIDHGMTYDIFTCGGGERLECDDIDFWCTDGIVHVSDSVSWQCTCMEI